MALSSLHAAEPDAAAPWIERGAVRLRAAGAQLAIDAAIAKAEEQKLKVNIAVVDDGGELYRFARMDGARPASVYTAITKATTAALIRAETTPLLSGETVNVQLNLAIENAAAASGGKFTSLKGGVPLVVDGQVIGAIGVGGATGEQDQEIARAAAEAFIKAVMSK
jgi:glc operon protein GlcG